MISADFAPNESVDDALVSLGLLFSPWRWRRGPALTRIKARSSGFFAGSKAYLFLTGRAALFHILASLNLKKGDEVIIQAFTCEAVILPILANKLRPIYADIETESFSMSLNDLEKKLSSRTRVLVLQHTFGLTPSSRSQILALAKKKDIIVIEDLAHGFDVELFKKDESRTIKLLSFGRSKAVSSIFGAAAVIYDEDLAASLKSIEKRLAVPSIGFLIQTLIYKPCATIIKATYGFGIGKIIHKTAHIAHLLSLEITQKERGGEFDNHFNKIYPNAFAKLAQHQFKKFERVYTQRAKICAFYSKKLAKYSPLKKEPRSKISLIRYPLLIDNRDSIVKSLAKQNIYLGTWYNQAVGPYKIDLKKMGYRAGSCPVAEAACTRIINLPTLISERKAKRVVEELEKVLTPNYSPLSKRLKKKAAKRKKK